MRARRGAYNIIFATISQIVTIALSITIPRLVLVSYGSEVNGLLSSVSQALVYLALLEAGVGAATIQALYGPVSLDNREKISAIMAATDRFYKKTGLWYVICVAAFSIVFSLVVKTNLSLWIVIPVILMSGLSGAVSYFFQGKYQLLLLAEGKRYILTNTALIINICISICKIILLLSGFNVVAVQAAYLIWNLVQTLYIVLYIKRRYKWLDLSVKPDYDAISQKNSAFIHQISTLVFSNTDVVILTVVCGLSTVSVYTMYALLFGMIGTLIYNVTGVQFALGQTFNADRGSYLKIHDAYEILSMGLTFSMFCVARIFILPFMKLYTAGVTDIIYIDQYLPYLFVAAALLSNGRTTSSMVINYAGHFKQTVTRTIAEASINMAVSIACVYRFGIYGVLFGTVAAMLYRANDMIIYANKRILNRSPWITYRRWLINAALFVAFSVFSHYVSPDLSTYPQIIGWAIVYTIIGVIVFFGVAFVAEPKVFQYVVQFAKPYLRKLRKR